jgi:hypothetical protein
LSGLERILRNAEDTRARVQAAHDHVCGGTDDVHPHVIGDALAGPDLEVRTAAECNRFQFMHALDRGLGRLARRALSGSTSRGFGRV